MLFRSTDPESKATSREGVFAGGDVETGPYIAIAAVAAGREAAISIDRYLQGQDLKAGRQLPLRPLTKEEGKWSPVRADIEKKQRALMQTLPVEQWIKGFEEINLGYREEEAVAEAARCINCGVCSECMQCALSCQAKAVAHDLLQAVDSAVAKLEHQVERLKGKRVARSHPRRHRVA